MDFFTFFLVQINSVVVVLKYELAIWMLCHSVMWGKQKNLHRLALGDQTGKNLSVQIWPCSKWTQVVARQRKCAQILVQVAFTCVSVWPGLFKNSTCFINIGTSGNIYWNSFFPRTIRNWNVLPFGIRCKDTLLDFKQTLHTTYALLLNYFLFCFCNCTMHCISHYLDLHLHFIILILAQW